MWRGYIQSKYPRYAAIIAVGSGLWLLAALVLPLQASAAQVGPAGQVTLNPGGGVLTNGTDGIRFTVNSAAGSGNPNYAYAGADAVVYRNTYQYCCGAGAPMLNIGGTHFGQAGPATSGSLSWNSIQVLSTSGATSEGTRTSAVGNSSATLLYTAVTNNLTYTIARTLTYVYPNDYVTDSYSFVIPDGNAATVKFYLGGDTAPGSSDSGYGIMLTSPVRSVISLNTSSQIMFGLREVAGSKPFDGATSQSFSAPYNTVKAGGNIGFVVTGSNHDAGLMMQWNLGSTPGTQTASMQQFATRQGTNLNAALSATSTNIDDPVFLNVSIANTVLSTVSSLGYTLNLPSGLVLGSGSPTNSCGGTLTSSSGASTASLSGASVTSGSNCIVSLPVVSSAAGTYAVSAASFSSLEGLLVNNVGAITLTVLNPVLGADLNDDGIEDSGQANVYSYTSPVTNKTVVLEVSNACSVSAATSVDENSPAVGDEGYEYVNGLMDFSLACGTPGFISSIKQYYYNVPNLDLAVRKYNPITEEYSTIDAATTNEIDINGNEVTVVTYQVEDGGELDTDGVTDGNISDPAGLAAVLGAQSTPGVVSLAASSTSSGAATTAAVNELARTGTQLFIVGLAGLLISSAAVAVTVRHHRQRTYKYTADR